jgi:hypothetical protein
VQGLTLSDSLIPTAATDIRIDWCLLDELASLQTFINTYWRRAHVLASDAELLRWQFRNQQDANRLSVLTAWEGKELLGFLGIIPATFNRYGEALPGAWLAMWSTAPHARGRRVGLALMRRALEGPYELVGALGLNETVTRIFRSLGFFVCESIPRWIRILSVPALERLLTKVTSIPSEAWSDLGDTGQITPITRPASIRIQVWNSETAARWDTAWRGDFAPRLVSTWKDAAYIKWRYVDHPRFEYAVRLAEDVKTGAVTGITVYRVERVRGGEGSVLRVLEFLGWDSAGQALASTIIEAGATAGCAFADFFCTSPPCAVSLEAAGFVQEDRLPALPSLFQPLDVNRVHLNGAWSVINGSREFNRTFFDTTALYATRSDGDQDRPS